jgi:omega-6 fatty acid desaturase (delta-12 desaturase)
METPLVAERLKPGLTSSLPKTSTGENLKANWRKLVAPYQHAELSRSLLMIADTLIPYLALWTLMIYSLQISYWLTLALVVPTAAFQVRLFIIFHDCGHGSFFKSHQANATVGFFLGILLFTPSEDWWHQHALHHATAGNLDKRGFGDVMTWTVDEYLQSSPFQRFTYGFFRHPLIMFTFGPFYSFLLLNRFSRKGNGKKERQSVFLTNLFLLAIFAIFTLTIGWSQYLSIQLPLMWLSGTVGIWLFYIQHQFENVYWVRENEWDFANAALEGASYYKLPRVLKWISGNIGFHHIHHLSPRIPNYLLEKCFNENPAFQEAVETITIRTSIKSVSLRLWDEKARKLISFRDIKAV